MGDGEYRECVENAARCSSSVHGFVRETAIFIPRDIVNAILSFYAEPITIDATFEEPPFQSYTVSVLYCPIYDSWTSLKHKLRGACKSYGSLEVHIKGRQPSSPWAWNALVRTSDGPICLDVREEEEPDVSPEEFWEATAGLRSFPRVDSLELYAITARREFEIST